MQRVRQGLPYFRENGWEPTVITVDQEFVEAYSTDELLLETFPQDIKVYKVPALKASLTRKVGIGSLSIRSYFQIKKKGDSLLRSEHFDLVYFSTTAFHVMALGPRWKKKFGVPFVLDIQDPWYNKFYFEKSLQSKSAKARVFHQIDKVLEGRTLPVADGIISVSSGYRDLYLDRYPTLSHKQFSIIPFGCATLDFTIAQQNIQCSQVKFSEAETNIVYIGRGGHDMEFATEIMLDAIALGIQKEPQLFNKVRVWFIGTSYAQAGKGVKTIEPVAKAKNLAHQVTEITDRLPYFETLHLLSKADMLFVPGSNDSTYTASKIYPYIYTNKPLLAIFHTNSSVCDVLRKATKGKLVSFADDISDTDEENLVNECFLYLSDVLKHNVNDSGLNLDAFEEYTAKAMAKKQIDFFDYVVENAAAN